MKTNSSLALAAALALGCGVAQADDNVFKVGVTRYDTHSKTNGISGIGVPPGADAVTNDAQYASAKYNLEAGREKFPQGRSLLLPQIGLTASASRTLARASLNLFAFIMS